MPKFLYQHYRVFLGIVTVGMAIMQTAAIFVYYGNIAGVNMENFNFLMMTYGIGVVTIFPFVVTFDATKRLRQHLPYKGGRAGWNLGITLNGLVCVVSWVFGSVEIFLKAVLFQNQQQIFEYVLALSIGSLLVLLLGGTMGWLAYRVAST